MKVTLAHQPYEFELTTPEEQISFAFEPTLFNLPEHVALQSAENIHSFYLYKKGAAAASGVWHIYLNEEEAKSPYRAPYGSAEFAAFVPLAVIEAFIKTILEFLEKKGVKSLLLKSYPFCYAPEVSALVTNSLLYYGFRLELSQINHHIPVSEASFESLLHNSERRRLRKCHRHNFVFKQEEVSFLPEAYAFIKACRIQKKKPLSMSEEQVALMFKLFPDRYFIFSVRNGDELAAVTVAVKVRSDILLTVYPASPYAYNAYSPSVMLNEGLYNYCQPNGITIFDMGISGVKEDPHYSLMQYKEHIGGLASQKLSLVWEKGN